LKTILLIAHSSNKTGGGEDDFQKLIEFLYGKYIIYSIFPNGPRSEEYKKYSNKYLEIKGNTFPFTKFSIKKYLGFIKVNYKKPFLIYSFLKKNKSINLCFVNSSVCILEVIPLILLKIPYILSVKEKINPTLMKYLFFLIYKSTAKKIITISKYLLEDIYHSEKNKNTEIIYSSINEEVFNKRIYIKQKKNNKDCNYKFKIINIGSIYSLKGQTVLIEALSKIKDLEIKIEFIGNIIERNYYCKMLKLIDTYKLSDNIQYLGELTKKDVIDKIMDADCVVITSKEEGQSLVLLEALYLEKPVITTKVGVATEIIDNNINGLLYDYGDSNSLSKLILELYENKKLYNSISMNCMNTYTKYFNSEKTLSKYEKNIIENML
jgi:glycosyltransferase involved in cell wall biosynthesis